jgi:glycosyltransferase involved in cell wall biosynthesis
MTSLNKKPLVTLILPVYNEEALLSSSLKIISDYCTSEKIQHPCEILLINDGSSDNTGMMADDLAKENKLLRVIHHPVNMNLGIALQTGFRNAKGSIIVVLDIDLSYSVEHINLLIDKLLSTQADVVIASPYMKGGKVTGVPFSRKILSKTVNLLMRFASQDKFYTYTGMVRAYKTEFIKNLNLKTVNYEINPEILYKASILRARIREIPAHLDWSFQNKFGKKRTSGMRLMQTTLSSLMASFIFRPYKFFLSLGLFFLAIASYICIWIAINTTRILSTLQVDSVYFDDRISIAIGQAFRSRPHAFVLGGITLILSIQILSLGFISLQKKRYFEELFHINSKILRILKISEKD